MSSHEVEMSKGDRFAFGANWARFLEVLNEERIALAENSLKKMLSVETLEEKTFLDIGSGSGLFSLVARRLGAKVYSFDYDPKSVACTAELKRRYFNNDSDWIIESGSVLDREYLKKLGQFDIVYSWGVLHHTGAMWNALENIAPLAKEKLFIAIYNDQGWPSKVWWKIKRLYNKLPSFLRWTILIPTFIRLWGPTTIKDFLKLRPFYTWKNYQKRGLKGMNAWHDVVDWVGGYPFEVAKPEEIFDFYKSKGFYLEKMTTCAGGHGCNEFVFLKAFID